MADEGGAIGNALQNLPIKQMLRDLALGISDAQLALDDASIAALLKAAKKPSGVKDDDGRDLTLLELGLVPSFYQFREATIDLSFSLSMKVEESMGVGVDMNFEHQTDTETGD